MKDKVIKKQLIAIESILMVILYPCLFMYFQNADEAKLADAMPAVGQFIVLAAVIFVVGLCGIKDIGKTAVFTNFTLFICLNFNTLFEKLGVLMGKKIIVLVCCILCILLAVFIKKKCGNSEKICFIISVCFGVLIIINFITAIPTIISKVSYEKEDTEGIVENFASEKPNVYYFIYDEYAGQQGLERYYDVDNSEFLETLEDLGFVISNSSHNTESCSTTVNVPNLLNIDYVAKADELEANNLKYMKNPKLIQIFKQNGYTVNLINHTDFLDNDSGNVLVTSGHIDTISTYIIQKSILQVFRDYYEELVKDDSEIGQYTTSLRNIMQTMEICASLVDEENPTLTVGYVSCPHVPFVFDENGKTVSKDRIHDWQDKDLYLNQLRYVNSCIKQTVENIISTDPEAVIILQSDHGVRYPLHMEELNIQTDYDIETETPYMQNILNCVYYKGKNIDIDGKIGINTLRTVLNDVFGTNYEMIEEK